MSLTERTARIAEVASGLGRRVQLMEVCGSHTMAVYRAGLRSLLPPELSLISGPGCPVCVTATSFIDHAVAIAMQPGTLVASFGDMLRVPGTEMSLETARARGGQVRVVYSPSDALDEAAASPRTRVVFLGVGFETTCPGVAWTVREAARRGLANYSVLSAHKVMPPAMAALLAAKDVRVDGFICPGHVSVIIGAGAYEFIARDHRIPCVIAGFEPPDILDAVLMLARQIGEGRAEVEVQYSRSVRREGNAEALGTMNEVFEETDTEWRGLGTIPRSGLRVRPAFAAHDAASVFAGLELPEPEQQTACICGDVLRGARSPADCPLFGNACTPVRPVGACMVSSEGACAACFRYGRKRVIR